MRLFDSYQAHISGLGRPAWQSRSQPICTCFRQNPPMAARPQCVSAAGLPAQACRPWWPQLVPVAAASSESPPAPRFLRGSGAITAAARSATAAGSIRNPPSNVMIGRQRIASSGTNTRVRFVWARNSIPANTTATTAHPNATGHPSPLVANRISTSPSNAITSGTNQTSWRGLTR